MAKVVVKSKVKKVKRKFPVEIVAPEYLRSSHLGSSNVSDLNSLIGKTSKINLMYITGNMKNQNVRLTLKIMEVNSGKATTEVSTYAQIPYYLGRFVKKGSDLIEISYEIKTKDGKLVQVKPFIVTKQNTSEMILSSIRAKTKELLEKEISSKKYADFIASVIEGKIQITLRNEVKKVFPLKTFEFRKVELK